MALVQYNFKIEEEMKDTAEQLSRDFSGKQEFLSAMLDSYKQLKQQNVDTNIDMSKYDNLEANTKKVLTEAFKHIIYTIQANNTNTKQLALSVEQDKESIIQERESFKKQIASIQATHNEELLKISVLHKEELEYKDEVAKTTKEVNQNLSLELKELKATIASQQKEIENLKSITEHTQSITNENTHLRKELHDVSATLKTQADNTAIQVKKLTDELSEKDKDAYRIDIESKSLEKYLQTLKDDLDTQKVQLNSKELLIRELEKENTIISTKLEMLTLKEKEDMKNVL